MNKIHIAAMLMLLCAFGSNALGMLRILKPTDVTTIRWYKEKRVNGLLLHPSQRYHARIQECDSVMVLNKALHDDLLMKIECDKVSSKDAIALEDLNAAQKELRSAYEAIFLQAKKECDKDIAQIAAEGGLVQVEVNCSW